MKRIVTIQDISGFGKCSLTVALPIISAMGVETAVVPTAVLSTHTGGFSGYTFRDLTSDIPSITSHWEAIKLHFDGIYTGYLGSTEQVNMVADFFDKFKAEDTKIIVDPVMGDGGKLYAGFTPDFVDGMKKLCYKADIIVPNMTEASYMLNVPFTENYDEAYVKEMLRGLTDLGSETAILTGIRYGDGLHGAVAYNSRTGEYCTSFRPHLDYAMHGTGDVFSSVLSGALVKGASVQKALDLATAFTVSAIEATVPDMDKYWYGVSFEPCLGTLAEESKNI